MNLTLYLFDVPRDAVLRTLTDPAQLVPLVRACSRGCPHVVTTIFAVRAGEAGVQYVSCCAFCAPQVMEIALGVGLTTAVRVRVVLGPLATARALRAPRPGESKANTPAGPDAAPLPRRGWGGVVGDA